MTLTFRDVSPATDSLDLLLDNVRLNSTSAPASASARATRSALIVEESGNLSVCPSGETASVWADLPFGSTYELQSSLDLLEWQDLAEIVGTGRTEILLEEARQEGGPVFYRAVPRTP